jgi:hypothetical protein
MAAVLSQLIAPYRAVSIIGMCKNAGKTTVLNSLLRQLADCGETLALTSIGRDGEGTDLVTGTKKPGIYVREGTLLATASELALQHCDVTREILDTTGIFTPMGEVVLLRARSDGAVQLGGPSMNSQLAFVRDQFFRLGADRVLIDGALSRKSLCSRHVTEATVLCTGASYHKSLDVVVEDTAHQCRLLTLPETEHPLIREVQEESRALWLFDADGGHPLPAGTSLTDELRRCPNTLAVFFGGALSDFAVQPLLMANSLPRDLTLVVRDSSKILLRRENFEKLLRRGIRVQVLESIHLVALTVNPFSAYGYPMDGRALLEKMQERVPVPVIDVMKEDGR